MKELVTEKVWSIAFHRFVDDVDAPHLDLYNRVLFTLDNGQLVDIPLCYIEPITNSSSRPCRSDSRPQTPATGAQ